MSGLYTLGQRSTIVGAWSLSDYKWGETQVQQLVNYFGHLGRPKEFEARVMALYGAYEKESTSSAILAAVNSDGMLNIGKQASALMSEIQTFMQAKAKGSGGVAPQGVPQGGDKPPPESSWLSWVPWWGWTILAVGALGAIAAYAVPPIMAAVTARRLTK